MREEVLMKQRVLLVGVCVFLLWSVAYSKQDKAFNWSPYPSPDGKRIVYASDRDERGNYEIYRREND